MALARTRPRRHPAAAQARATALRWDRTDRRVRDARQGSRGLMSDQDDAARRMAFFQQLAREAAAAGVQDECDNPDCACHRDAGDRPGDGAAEVTMTEVYKDDPDGAAPPAGDTPRPGDFGSGILMILQSA